MLSNNDKFLDLINVLSLIVGIQNLQENREQSAQNNIHTENDAQTKYLLSELTRQFEEQNKLLNKILNILEDFKNVNTRTETGNLRALSGQEQQSSRHR